MEKSKRLYYKIDLPLLLFIIGAVYVKTYIKVISIGLYFLYLFIKKISFPKKNANVVKFYLLIPIAGIIAPLFNHSFGVQGYLFGYLFGTFQWLICAAIFYILYAAIKNIEKEKIIKTVEAFFVINILVTVIQLVIIMVLSSSIMPYWIYDAAEQYGVSTGDRLYGIFANISITNAAISVLGGIYFLFNQKIIKSILCFLIMLLCTSNLSLLFSLCILLLILCFCKVRIIKKQSFLIIIILLVLYPIISPGNLKYINTIYDAFVLHIPTKYENPDSLTVIGENVLTEKQDDSLEKIGIIVPRLKMVYKLNLFNPDPSIYISQLKELKYNNQKYRDPKSNVLLDQTQLKKSFTRIYGIPIEDAPLNIYSKPGKIHAYKQTYYFLRSNPENLFFGAGTGNFSSKLAIKMTGLELQGKYPEKYVYANKSFMEYHLYTIFYYLCQNIALHSVLNMPNSVYNQLAGEYGLIGIILFVVLYLGYFWKRSNRYGYGKYLIVVLLLFFGVDYWFEMASLTVIFELLMLMDIFVYTNDNADNPTLGNGTHAGV